MQLSHREECFQAGNMIQLSKTCLSLLKGSPFCKYISFNEVKETALKKRNLEILKIYFQV